MFKAEASWLWLSMSKIRQLASSVFGVTWNERLPDGLGGKRSLLLIHPPHRRLFALSWLCSLLETKMAVGQRKTEWNVYSTIITKKKNIKRTNQVLYALDMSRVNSNRVFETILSVRETFFHFKNTATLKEKKKSSFQNPFAVVAFMH